MSNWYESVSRIQEKGLLFFVLRTPDGEILTRNSRQVPSCPYKRQGTRMYYLREVKKREDGFYEEVQA